MDDPLETLADEELYVLAVDIRLQLEKGAGTRPLVHLLALQRRRAAQAVLGLINADAEDTTKIRGFQQEAKLYHDLITNCRAMLQLGKEADRSIAENERIALSEAVDSMSQEERKALKIEPRGDD